MFTALVFAQLFVNRFYLLAQNVIALRLVHFGLRFAGNLRSQTDDLDFARQKVVRPVHQLVHSVGFEHLLLALDTEAQNRAEKICEPDRIVSAQHDHANFRRHLRQIGEGLLNQRLHVALCSFDFFLIRDQEIGENLHARAQKRSLLHPLQNPNSIGALHDQMKRIFDALHAFDHYEGADFEEVSALGVLIVSLLRPHADAGEEFFFTGQRGFDGRDRCRPAGGQRHHRFREQRSVPQRQHRNLERLRAEFLRGFLLGLLF